jgi:hypothetical protein
LILLDTQWYGRSRLKAGEPKECHHDLPGMVFALKMGLRGHSLLHLVEAEAIGISKFAFAPKLHPFS